MFRVDAIPYAAIRLPATRSNACLLQARLRSRRAYRNNAVCALLLLPPLPALPHYATPPPSPPGYAIHAACAAAGARVAAVCRCTAPRCWPTAGTGRHRDACACAACNTATALPSHARCFLPTLPPAAPACPCLPAPPPRYVRCACRACRRAACRPPPPPPAHACRLPAAFRARCYAILRSLTRPATDATRLPTTLPAPRTHAATHAYYTLRAATYATCAHLHCLFAHATCLHTTVSTAATRYPDTARAHTPHTHTRLLHFFPARLPPRTRLPLTATTACLLPHTCRAPTCHWTCRWFMAGSGFCGHARPQPPATCLPR